MPSSDPAPRSPWEPATADGLVVDEKAQLPLKVQVEGGPTHSVSPTLTPGWYSLVPPLVAIALALIFREVVTALFAGVWLGALAVAGFNPITGTWRLIDTFVVPALGDTAGGHTQVVIFSLLLGGMVGIIARNGGTLGIVEAVAPFARTARRGKFATWAAGMAIFFDDYANTLIVGNTMRPITDRLKISREKLAYLVDSTAAPVAAIIPISTWVGYEISLIADGLRIAAQQSPEHAAMLADSSAFAIFIETIPYRFYPVLALFFALLVCVMDRDLGPMARAERRAAPGGGLYRPGAQLATDTNTHIMDPKEGTRHRWWNAAFPVITVHRGRSWRGSTPPGGREPARTRACATCSAPPTRSPRCCGARWRAAWWRSRSPWASASCSVTECIDAWLGGMRAMIIAMIILVLAWSLGAATQEIGTAQYLTQLLSDRVSLHFLPGPGLPGLGGHVLRHRDLVGHHGDPAAPGHPAHGGAGRRRGLSGRSALYRAAGRHQLRAGGLDLRRPLLPHLGHHGPVVHRRPGATTWTTCARSSPMRSWWPSWACCWATSPRRSDSRSGCPWCSGRRRCTSS